MLSFSLVCDLCTVQQGLFTLPIGVTNRLCSVIVAITGQLCYFNTEQRTYRSMDGSAAHIGKAHYLLKGVLFFYVD